MWAAAAMSLPVLQAVDPYFPAPTIEAASHLQPLSSFELLIDTPDGRNMRKSISGSGRGAYNSVIAAQVPENIVFQHLRA